MKSTSCNSCKLCIVEYASWRYIVFVEMMIATLVTGVLLEDGHRSKLLVFVLTVIRVSVPGYFASSGGHSSLLMALCFPSLSFTFSFQPRSQRYENDLCHVQTFGEFRHTILSFLHCSHVSPFLFKYTHFLP